MATKLKAKLFDPAEYLKTPEAVAAYLESAFESGDAAVISDAIGVVTRSAGIAQIAKKSGRGRESLYKGGPRLALPASRRTMLHHLDRVDIPPELLSQWIAVAEDLGDPALGLVVELSDFRDDPTRHMLGRAAKVARHVESRLTGQERNFVNVPAGQIEDAAG